MRSALRWRAAVISDPATREASVFVGLRRDKTARQGEKAAVIRHGESVQLAAGSVIRGQ